MNMISDNPFLMLFGVPASVAPLFIVPWLLLVGGLVLVVLAGFAWKREAWRTTGRVHYTLIALSAVIFSSLLISWGLV